MVTGSYTHTTSSEAAVAIGTKSQATGELSTAFGTGTRAEGVASAAFGMGAKATKGTLWQSVRAVRLQPMQPKSTKLLSTI